MKTFVLSSLVTTLGFAAAAYACEGMAHGTTAKAAPKDLALDVVAAAITAPKSQYAVVDANDQDTRQKYGVIPGAILLSGCETYDVKKELPADKAGKLIFYCGGEKCSAAPKAAQRAIDAGYTDVFVMKAGIKGWTAAGKPVTRVQS